MHEGNKFMNSKRTNIIFNVRIIIKVLCYMQLPILHLDCIKINILKHFFVKSAIRRVIPDNYIEYFNKWTSFLNLAEP